MGDAYISELLTLIGHMNKLNTKTVDYRGVYRKKFKKISKRNLPNVGMGGWMEALADKVHKQGEHIPQHATFHTTIPT